MKKEELTPLIVSAFLTVVFIFTAIYIFPLNLFLGIVVIVLAVFFGLGTIISLVNFLQERHRAKNPVAEPEEEPSEL